MSQIREDWHFLLLASVVIALSMTFASSVATADPFASTDPFIVTDDETVQLTIDDSPLTTSGAIIGGEPDNGGDPGKGGTFILGVASVPGTVWTNNGGFYTGFGWTDDTVGLLIGSPDEPMGYTGDVPSTGVFLMHNGTTFYNTGNVWIGGIHPEGPTLTLVPNKIGNVTVAAESTWYNVGQPEDSGQSDGFWLRNGELNLWGTLYSQSGTTFGADGGTSVVNVEYNGRLVVGILDEWGDVEDYETLFVSGRASGSSHLFVTGDEWAGGTVEVGFLHIGEQGLARVGTLGDSSAAQSTITAIDVTVSDNNGRLLIDNRGRVDTESLEVRSGGIVGVNQDGLLVIPGNTLQFPFRAFVGAGGTVGVLNGGKFVMGGGLGDPSSLESAAVHIGFGSRMMLQPNGEILGNVRVHNGGVLSANGKVNGDVQVNLGGLVHGNGVITGDLAVAAGGIVNPGNSIGILTVEGNVVLNTNSILTIEVNSTGNDRLDVLGQLTLGGELNLAFIDGFSPGLGDSFMLSSIFIGDVAGGSFDNFSVSGLGEGLTISEADFAALAAGDPVQVTVVPEPTSLAMLAVASMLLFGRRQRR